MSVKVMGLVFEAQLPPSEKILLLALADHAGHDGEHVFPSQLLMALKTSMSVRTIRRMLRSLEAAGLIVKTKAADHANPAHYRIDLDAVRRLALTPESMAQLEHIGAVSLTPLATTGRPTDAGRADTSVRSGRTPVSAEPSVEPSEEPTSLRVSSPSTLQNGFEDFWREYPKKKSRHDAEKAWKKERPPLPAVLEAIRRLKQSRDWKKDGGQFIPYPATWINAHGWLDEVDEAYPTANGSGYTPAYVFGEPPSL